VAYQVSERVASLCQPILGPGKNMLELLNIPPMRVYKWEKQELKEQLQ
jgi:phosphatidylethanolamine/phosphatidyl-N-methylethanolamine N-methyltransferase